MLRKSLYALLVALLVSAAPAPAPAAEQAPLRVCFTPGGDCTDLVAGEIAAARHQILVEADSFTSVPIISALHAAHDRGVDVEVIVDKTSAGVDKSGSALQRGRPIRRTAAYRLGRQQGRHRPQQGHDHRRGPWSSPGASTSPPPPRAATPRICSSISDPVAVAAQYRDNWRRRQAVSQRFGRPVEGQSG